MDNISLSPLTVHWSMGLSESPELEGAKAEENLAHSTELPIVTPTHTAQAEQETKEIAEQETKEAAATGVTKPKVTTLIDAKHQKHVEALYKYFKSHHLNIYTDFANLQLGQVVLLAAIDLFATTVNRFQKSLTGAPLEDVTEFAKTALDCCYAIVQFTASSDKLWHSQITEKTLEELFPKLLAESRLSSQKELDVHWKNIRSLLIFPDDLLKLPISAFPHSPMESNQKKLLDYVSAEVTKVSSMMSMLYNYLYNSYKPRVDSLKYQARVFHEKQTDLIKDPSKHSFYKKLPNGEVVLQDNPPRFAKAQVKSSSKLMERTFDRYQAGLNFLEAYIKLANQDFGFKQQKTPLHSFLHFSQFSILSSNAWSDFYHNFPTYAFTNSAELVRELKNSNVIKENEKGIDLSNIQDETRIVAGNFFCRHTVITSIMEDLFAPVMKILLRGCCDDWRDSLELDIPTSEKTQAVEQEIPDIEPEPLSYKPSQESKKQKRAIRHKPSTSKQKIVRPGAVLKGIVPVASSTPPGVQFFHDFRMRLQETINWGPTMGPADLMGLSLSRADRARANQSYALYLHERGMEIMQRKECYTPAGKLNRCGDTINRFDALQAACSCEQADAVVIIERDPGCVLVHNQAENATRYGLNASHAATQILGIETSRFRYPRDVTEARRAELSTRSQWIGFVADKLSAGKEKREIWDLPLRSDSIGLDFGADQVKGYTAAERELQTLEKEIAALSPDYREKEMTLIGISKLLGDVCGFGKSIVVMGHQRYLSFFATGIFLSLQTLVDHTWKYSLLQQGRRNISVTRAEDFHNIVEHLEKGEFGTHLSDSDKDLLSLLQPSKAFELLPGHCAERRQLDVLPQMLSNLYLLSEATADTQKVCGIKGKPGFETTEEVMQYLTKCNDIIIKLINVVCKVIRQDVLG